MPSFKNSAAIAAAVLTMFGTNACMTTGSSGKGIANKAPEAKQSVSKQDAANKSGWFDGMKDFFSPDGNSKFHANNLIDASMEQGFTSVTRNGNDIIGKGYVKDKKTGKGICEYSMCFDPKSGKGTFEASLMDKSADAVKALSQSIDMPNDKIISITLVFHTNHPILEGYINRDCTISRVIATDHQGENIEMPVDDLAHGKIYSGVYKNGVESALTDKTKDLSKLAPPVIIAASKTVKKIEKKPTTPKNKAQLTKLKGKHKTHTPK